MGKVLVFMEFKHGFLLTFFDLKKKQLQSKNIIFAMCYSFSEIHKFLCICICEIGHKEFGFKQNYFTCSCIKKSLFWPDKRKKENALSLMCEMDSKA